MMDKIKEILFQTLIFMVGISIGSLSYAENTNDSELGELNNLVKSLKTEFEHGPIGGSEGWKFIKEKNGIKIYTCKVDITPVESFRVEMEVEGDLDAIVGLISFDADYPDWMYLVNESKVLRKLNETDMFVYTVNQPIWPCKVRDACTFKWWSQDSETLVVRGRFIGIHDFLPEKKGFIRVPLLMGQYIVTPKSNGRVHIMYEALTDPDVRWVPKWAIAWTARWCGYLTLNKIRVLLPLDEYKDKCPSWLKVSPKAAKPSS